MGMGLLHPDLLEEVVEPLVAHCDQLVADKLDRIYFDLDSTFEVQNQDQ